MKKIDIVIKEVYPHAYTSVWTVVDPFVGGGGSLINMAIDFPLWKFHVNDNNPNVGAMWKLFKTSRDVEFDALYKMIREQIVNVETYRKIFDSIPQTPVEKAFKVIFLNKTSYNGLITIPRPIGGWDQKSKWNVDVYWNPEGIIDDIRRFRIILENRILSVFSEDFETFMNKVQFDFAYLDPPYMNFGKSWYKCSFGIADLERLKNALNRTKQWCLSIDRHLTTEDLFKKNLVKGVDVTYTAKSSYKSKREDPTIQANNEMIVFP